MVEYQQILSLVIISSLYLFLLWLVRSFKIKLAKSWFLVLTFIVLGEGFSLIEDFYFYSFFNVIEHLCIALSCFSFFLAIYNIKEK